MHWGGGKQPCVRGGSSHLAGQPECMAVHQAAGSIILYLVRVQCSLETEAGFYVQVMWSGNGVLARRQEY